MKKFLFLLLLVVSSMACSTAPPPVLLANNVDVQNIDIANIAFDADLPNSTNRLYASLSVIMQDENPESIEKDSGFDLSKNIEAIIGIIMFIMSTVFGTYFKKYLGKFKQAIGLLDLFHNALEDGNLSKTEIAALKQKYYQLIGKEG